MLINDQGIAEIGAQDADGTNFQVDFTVQREVVFEPMLAFRLLLKGSLLEFYLDDILIECYSLPSPTTGKIGFINGGENAAFNELTAWG